MSHKREGQILKEEIGKGLGALRRSTAGLFVSGLSGGLRGARLEAVDLGEPGR